MRQNKKLNKALKRRERQFYNLAGMLDRKGDKQAAQAILDAYNRILEIERGAA